MNLAEAALAQAYLITGFSGEALWVDRLKEMGLRRGLPVQLLKRMSFGGPVIVRAGQGYLALRYEEAECIQITARL